MVAPEKLAMQTCTVDLIDGLASDNIGSLVDHLYDKRLMSVDVYDKIRLTMVIPRDKAREAVSHVSARVNADPEVTFRSFIKVLRDNGYSKLVKKLEDKFVEHGGDKTCLKQATHPGGKKTKLLTSNKSGEVTSGRKRLRKDKKAAQGDGSKLKRSRGATFTVQPDSQEYADDNDSDDDEDDSSDSDNEYISKTPEAPVSTKLKVANLQEVIDATYSARAKWYEIGLALNVSVGTLEAIEDEKNIDKRHRVMLLKWLEKGRNKSWSTLIEALRSKIVGRTDIADELAAKYL